VKILSLCLLVLPCLTGCQANNGAQVTYAAGPEVNARADGQARGVQFAAARTCGVTPVALKDRADAEPSPPVATPELAAVYQKAFTGAYNMPMEPTPEFCAATRRQPEFASLFPAELRLPLQQRSTVQGLPPERTAKQPPERAARNSSQSAAYCPAGSLAASMAPSMTEGLEILRARCKPGDSLLLQRQNTGLIASACDLNKLVSAVGGDMLCTMGVVREMRQ